jgi:tetratricopeptide (TPR) repeat protein/predicted Ser/Thr protein kinase
LRAELFQIESDPIRIGRFPILGRLGQGGMGTVFSAYDEQLDRKIAVKVMLRDAAGGSVGRERMRREAQAMARLSHPNIVAVHEVGDAGGQDFIAMEFVRGVSLDVWLAKESPGWREVLEVFRHAGLGLAAAHGAGLVHRDFKPRNVMVADDGQIKILDFGLARAAEDAPTDQDDDATPAAKIAAVALTRSGAIAGTPAYMAPEQYLGRPATAASDQFSFCVALYCGLFRTHPFDASSLAALAEAVLEGAPAPPPKESQVPTWVRRAVMRGLSREPEQRFPSLSALLDALAADPGARRRRWLGGSVAAAAVLGIGVGIARLAGTAPCPDGRTELKDVWDDERRPRVAEAVRSGATHGPDTWLRVEPALDRYADEWISARERACDALRRGVVSTNVHDHRVACLSRSRVALDALIEVFEHADVTVVDKAVSATSGLPAIARCEDDVGLLAPVEPPTPEIADEVVALRDALARARSVEDAGRVGESVAEATVVLERAEQLAYAPLIAEAHLRRGSGELLAGDAVAADEDLGRSAWLAMQSSADPVAAEAAARRVFVRSELLGKPADAEIELPWARALVERADDPALTGLFLHNAATVKSRGGDPDGARALAREALETRRRILPGDHPDIALSLANLGHFERDLGDYTAAISSLREALQVTEVALGPRHPQRAMIGAILGAALLEVGDVAAAREELELDDAICRETLGADALPRYSILVAMGEIAGREQRFDDARAKLEQALTLAIAAVGSAHPMLTDARLALAEVAAAEGKTREALDLGLGAIESLETALGEAHPYLADAWLRLGRLLQDAGDHARARPCFTRAMEIARALQPASALDLEWYGFWHAWAGIELSGTARKARMREAAGVLAAGLNPASPRLREVENALAAEPVDDP